MHTCSVGLAPRQGLAACAAFAAGAIRALTAPPWNRLSTEAGLVIQCKPPSSTYLCGIAPAVLAFPWQFIHEPGQRCAPSGILSCN